MDIRNLVETRKPADMPQISPGDTIKVISKFKEGDKERLQSFQGVVIKVRRGTNGGSFTIRRVSFGVGVERTIPFLSPAITKIEVIRHGRVRRSKLYYMRRLSAREARLKERREKLGEEATVETEAQSEE